MGRDHARDGLPWRHIDDPYGVCVSEVMLQQTQVKRVLDYWESWMKAFPTIDALASASTSDVLLRWQGLGYNRRALALKRAADTCAAQYGGAMPATYEELIALDGIGPATAAGILSFAFQQPSVYLETNVRSVFLYHFFSDSTEKVSDRHIVPLVEQTCDTGDPRNWYYALLDYGAFLKRRVPNPSRKAKAYTRQAGFEGSRRQKRAFVLREVLANPGISLNQLHELLDESERASGRGAVDDVLFDSIVAQLSTEGFFRIDEDKLYT